MKLSKKKREKENYVNQKKDTKMFVSESHVNSFVPLIANTRSK